jgi:hypothetical protein
MNAVVDQAVRRVFTDEIGVRRQVPIHVGFVGPSGSGKTKSALRAATGMQRVTGGDIYGIDTEANRMLHYADQHRFRHVPFTAPFDALSYLAAVEYCVAKGAKIIIIDSASHLHEGPGGTLEMHEAECERLMKAWTNATRDKVQMSAWQKPKAELRRFLNAVLQMQINIIWCYRAKEKLKVIPGQQPKQLGFMPIAGDEMIYEMTLNCLLYPNSGGVPAWHPEEMGERAIIKLPQQFQELFKEPRPIDEDIGQKLAEWAAGSKAPEPLAESEIEAHINGMLDAKDLATLEDRHNKAREAARPAKDIKARDKFRASYEAVKATLSAQARQQAAL